MNKKTYISPSAKAVSIAADNILTSSIHSSDRNQIIDALNFDTEGTSRVDDSNNVW